LGDRAERRADIALATAATRLWFVTAAPIPQRIAPDPVGDGEMPSGEMLPEDAEAFSRR